MNSSKNIIHSTEAPSSSLSVLSVRNSPSDIVTSMPMMEKGGVVVATGTSLPELEADEGQGEESNSAQEKILRRRRLIQFATLCWCFILEGWNDGSTGPLLPRIQNTYHVRVPVDVIVKPHAESNYIQVNYTVVSLIFILQCVVRPVCTTISRSSESQYGTCQGFIIGAMLNIHLTERLGFGKV